jgi:predicted PurR-regulated permease PerM
MSAGQIAVLIAAVFFAAGMAAVVYVLVRLGGLISSASRALTDYHDRASSLIEHANAAADRAHEQLARTGSITASMDEVTANMAELSGHVSALVGLARGISAGFGTPLLRVSALAFGVRRAVTLRSGGSRRLAGGSAAAGTLAAAGQPQAAAAAQAGTALPQSGTSQSALSQSSLAQRRARRGRR